MDNHILYFNLNKKRGDTMELKKKKMLEIEKKVSQIIKDIDFTKNPSLDIVPLVEKDGFVVKPTLMPLGITGCLLVNEKDMANDKTILVNKVFKNTSNEENIVLKKSRFITAHEYGHYILHKQKNQPIYAHRDTDHREEEKEQEADYFARSILMPFKVFQMYEKVCNEITSNDTNFTIMLLSEAFCVTQNKVKKRMEDMSLLK